MHLAAFSRRGIAANLARFLRATVSVANWSRGTLRQSSRALGIGPICRGRFLCLAKPVEQLIRGRAAASADELRRPINTEWLGSCHVPPSSLMLAVSRGIGPAWRRDDDGFWH